MTLINTNARSLCPKIDSLIDCFQELSVDIAIITETWLKDGQDLEQNLSDLEHGAGLSLIPLNREPNPATGVAHGGVAVVYRKKVGSFKKIDFPNPHGYEVLPVVGSIRGSSRKLVVIAAYLPPNYTVPRGAGCLEHIENVLVHVKQRFKDPFIALGGDFNQWSGEDAIAEYPDMREVLVGPTRGDRAIDRLFTNMSRSLITSGTVPPLEAEQSLSDHRVAYASFKIQRQ